MFPQTESIARNAELLRRFGMLTANSYGEFMGQQLETSEQLFMRNSRKMQDLLGKSANVSSLEEWLQAIQNTAQCAIEMVHEMVVTVAAHDVEIRRLAHKQAAEMQQFYSESFKGLDVQGDEKLIGDKRSGKKLAA